VDSIVDDAGWPVVAAGVTSPPPVKKTATVLPTRAGFAVLLRLESWLRMAPRPFTWKIPGDATPIVTGTVVEAPLNVRTSDC
jgi:hypothetical protein